MKLYKVYKLSEYMEQNSDKNKFFGRFLLKLSDLKYLMVISNLLRFLSDLEVRELSQ